MLCVSDGVDGYLARRHGTTRSGAFLDPLADKVLVLGAMFTLVGNGVFWIVPVAIIAAREFIISMYRTVVGSKGVSVPASRMAKCKTLAQQLAVGFALLPLTAVDADVAVERRSCGWPSCWPSSSGAAVPAGTRTRVPRGRDAEVA